jgi:hypothetical protein
VTISSGISVAVNTTIRAIEYLVLDCKGSDGKCLDHFLTFTTSSTSSIKKTEDFCSARVDLKGFVIEPFCPNALTAVGSMWQVDPQGKS